MKFLLTILTISTVFLSATVAALTPAEQCQKQFAPGTPALSNCLKQLNQAAPVKPAPAPLVAVPPPKPAPTPVAVAPPPKPQVQAQVAQPAPKVQPIQQAPLQPSIAPQPARPATAVAPLTPATPAAHAAVNYRVTPPVNVQVGKQMDFVVNVDRGTLPPDIVIVVPNAKLLGKSGNKISFLATTAGNQPFQLKESMSSSAKVLATGSVMVAAAASTPRTPTAPNGSAISATPAVTGVTSSANPTVGQPVTLLFNGKNLNADVRVTASDCMNVGNQQLVNTSQIKLTCTPQKVGNMVPGWRQSSGASLISLNAVSVAAKTKGLSTPLASLIFMYGLADLTYSVKNGREHTGVDYGASSGTQVRAICDGVVKLNQTSNKEIMNAFLIIEHLCPAPLGKVYAYYGHINSPLKPSSKVVSGVDIGSVREWPKWPSNTHLHFGLKTNYVSSLWGTAPKGTSKQAILNDGWMDPALYFK